MTAVISLMVCKMLVKFEHLGSQCETEILLIKEVRLKFTNYRRDF